MMMVIAMMMVVEMEMVMLPGWIALVGMVGTIPLGHVTFHQTLIAHTLIFRIINWMITVILIVMMMTPSDMEIFMRNITASLYSDKVPLYLDFYPD